MIVGKENPKTFQLHSELIANESDRLAKDVRGGFDEQSTKCILLDEEDPELFGFFVEYLYCRQWLEKEEELRASDYIIVARLYALGERLQAVDLQNATLRKFTVFFPPKTPLPEQDICDLLEIACAELPDKVHEDPLRAQIFWYAATRLSELRKHDYFLRLLELEKDLGRYLCVRAGNSATVQPTRTALSIPLPTRFRQESIYQS